MKQILRFHPIKFTVTAIFLWLIYDSGRNTDTAWFSYQVYFCVIQFFAVVYSIGYIVKYQKEKKDHLYSGMLALAVVLTVISLLATWSIYDMGVKSKVASCGEMDNFKAWAVEKISEGQKEYRVESNEWSEIVSCVDPKSVTVMRAGDLGQDHVSVNLFGGVLGGKWLLFLETPQKLKIPCQGGVLKEWEPNVYSLFCPD